MRVRNCLGPSEPSQSEAYRTVQGAISPRECWGPPGTPAPTARAAGHSWLESRRAIRRAPGASEVGEVESRGGRKGKERRRGRVRTKEGGYRAAPGLPPCDETVVALGPWGFVSPGHWPGTRCSGYLLDTPHLIPPHGGGEHGSPALLHRDG